MLRVPFIDVIGSVSQENVSQFLSLGLERKKLNKKKTLYHYATRPGQHSRIFQLICVSFVAQWLTRIRDGSSQLHTRAWVVREKGQTQGPTTVICIFIWYVTLRVSINSSTNPSHFYIAELLHLRLAHWGHRSDAWNKLSGSAYCEFINYTSGRFSSLRLSSLATQIGAISTSDGQNIVCSLETKQLFEPLRSPKHLRYHVQATTQSSRRKFDTRSDKSFALSN